MNDRSEPIIYIYFLIYSYPANVIGWTYTNRRVVKSNTILWSDRETDELTVTDKKRLFTFPLICWFSVKPKSSDVVVTHNNRNNSRGMLATAYGIVYFSNQYCEIFCSNLFPFVANLSTWDWVWLKIVCMSCCGS